MSLEHFVSDLSFREYGLKPAQTTACRAVWRFGS